jgi:hypothetical protein
MALTQKMYALKLKQHMNADTIILKGISDSEYAGDGETRISFYGYMILLLRSSDFLENQIRKEPNTIIN